MAYFGALESLTVTNKFYRDLLYKSNFDCPQWVTSITNSKEEDPLKISKS